MARIPILQEPGQLNTGNQTIRTPDLPAVTNASMGKALGNVSNVMFDIAEKAKRANDVTKLTEASLAMNKAQMEFATFQQSPEGQDEKNWLPKWQSLQKGIKNQFDQAELTPEARMQFTDNLSNWATRGTINVQAQAFKQAGARMDAVVELAKQDSVATGNLEPARQAIQNKVKAGFQTPEGAALEFKVLENQSKAKKSQDLRQEESELMRLGNEGNLNAWVELEQNYNKQKELGALTPKEHERAIAQLERGSEASIVRSRIYAWGGFSVDLTEAKRLITQSKLTPQMRMELEDEIARASNRYANQDLIAFTDRMARGEAVSGDDFTSQYMGEAQLASVRSKINEATPTTPEQQAAFYLETMKVIDNFDPVKAKENDFNEMVKVSKAALAIRKAPPHLRDMLSDAMQAKLSGSESKGLVADGEKRARSMLLEIVKSKEADFFEGSGEKKKLIDSKKSEWMDFQQRVFNLENDVSDRIKNVNDTQKINQIVSDVLGTDYVKVKKQQRYMPPTESGFGPINPSQIEEGSGVILPMPTWNMQDTQF
jgi:hypothetical protein